MYYVLDYFGAINPCRWITSYPYVEDMDFDLGKKITVAVPDPLEINLDPMDKEASDQGPEMPVYFKGQIPICRDDLIQSMKDVGVTNLDIYNVRIFDPDSGKHIINYKAVNIVGVVAIADMKRSDATVHIGGPVIDVDFDNLVIDPSKTSSLLIFRLAESTNTILVNDKLRCHLLAQGYDKLQFLDPTKVAT